MYFGKSRGQKRKFNTLIRRIDKIEPFTKTENEEEHFHVPCGTWLSMPKTSGKIKTEFCRRWIEKTEEIISQKPDGLPFCKVVAAVCYPDVRDSQIIIFYDENYYSSFWNRNGTYQKWTRIENKSFMKERNIKSSLPEAGYIEELNDEDYSCRSYIWFYGELPF